MRKNKLKDMELTSIDVCERGANQRADIMLRKNRDGESATDEMSTLRKAFDYLRHLFGGEEERVEKSVTITKADIEHEYSDYMDVLKSSFKMILDDETTSPSEKSDLMKKSLCEFQSFMYPATEAWSNTNVVAKSAPSLDATARMADKQQELMECTASLNASINSIAEDDCIAKSEKFALMDKSIDQFADVYKNVAKEALLGKRKNVVKEGDESMNLENLTPEEQTILKSLMAKACNSEDDPEMDKACGGKKRCAETEKACGGGSEDEMDKACGGKKVKKEDPEVDPMINEEDIPESVKKAIQKSNQFIEQMEMRDMADIAKKYEILGEKPEELAKSLYELKNTNEAVYKSCIAMLDNQISLINKSGLFTEIGKSGVQNDAKSSVAKARNVASEIMKSHPDMTYDQAMAQAWDSHPELLQEYDEGR